MMARGALELMWDACYESGETYVGTSDDLEHLLGWTGEPGMLTRALVEAGAPEGEGFIEPASETVDGGVTLRYRVHDLWHHAPDYVAKRRKRELERQQKGAPEPVRQTAPNGGHWSQTSDCQNGVGRTPSPSPSPSPKEKKVCSEASSEPSSPPFLEFPIVGTKGPGWTLSEAQVAEWASLFPGLDVGLEAGKALAWVKANPGRRKTAGGMARFLVSWLNRANDRGGTRSVSVPVASRAPTYQPWVCPDEPKCPPGTSRFRCHQRAQLEAARKSGAA